MAFFITQISDDTEMFIEAETTGAFTKSDLEVRPDPLKAFLNTVDAAAKLGVAFSDRLTPTMAATNSNVDVRFGLKVDGNGSVMISKEATLCQFQVTIRFNGSGASGA
jgi:hypothetical protein